MTAKLFIEIVVSGIFGAGIPLLLACAIYPKRDDS